jgi:hypothetical protein
MASCTSQAETWLVQVKAWECDDASDATLLSCRQGVVVRELIQILYHHLLSRCETDTRPVRLYLKGRACPAGEIVEPAPTVCGCAGIHLPTDCAQMLASLFDGKGYLPVRFSKPSSCAGCLVNIQSCDYVDQQMGLASH